MSNLLLIFPVLSMLCASALWAILGRPRFLKRTSTTDDLKQSVSVIIPARNEEDNIALLLKSLQNQSLRPIEIIVVDDGSEDATARIARELGASVVEAGALPSGWKGKSWACHQGSKHATGDWLLFLDADLLFGDDAIASLLNLGKDKPMAYSVCPYHTIRSPYEELSAFFNVLMLAGSNAFTPFPDDHPLLFGQCLFVRNDDYHKIGTHESIKGEILENFQLSKKFQENGIPCTSLLGKGLISMRMFPEGINQLSSSWQKGFTSGAAQTTPRALALSSVWLSGLMCTLTSFALIAMDTSNTAYLFTTAAAYLLGAIQCLYVFRLAGNFSILNALFFPVTLLFYQGVFFTSLIKKKMGIKPEWKGRQID